VTGSRRLVIAVALAAIAAAGAIALRSTAATPASLSYFLVSNDPAVVDWRVRTQWDVAERLVRDCMLAAGFPYVALELPTSNAADAALAPRERVAKDGFGATTRLDPPVIVEADPNMSYLDSLAPAQQAAYRTALLGEEPPGDPGCQQRAQSAVQGQRSDAIASIDDLVAELVTAKAQDPAVQRGEIAWRACARAAGLPVGRQDAQSIGHDIFAGRLAEATGSDGGYDASRLAALQEEERRVALAIYACDEAFADDTRTAASDVEVGWATRHAERLETLRLRLLRLDADLDLQSR